MTNLCISPLHGSVTSDRIFHGELAKNKKPWLEELFKLSWGSVECGEWLCLWVGVFFAHNLTLHMSTTHTPQTLNSTWRAPQATSFCSSSTLHGIFCLPYKEKYASSSLTDGSRKCGGRLAILLILSKKEYTPFPFTLGYYKKGVYPFRLTLENYTLPMPTNERLTILQRIEKCCAFFCDFFGFCFFRLFL